MIDKLNPHYSMTNLSTIYDEEALTSMELAARTAGKLNEVVDGFNQLDKTTAAKLANQTAAIQEMNDVTMPAKVKAEFTDNLNNGTFESMVDTYAGELSDRLNNLLNSTPQGSTTMDAEVIDGRLSAAGETYSNLGDGIRAQLNTKMNGVFRYTPANLTRYDNSVYSRFDNQVLQVDDYVCARLDITTEKILRISCSAAADGFPAFIVWRADGTWIYYHHPGDHVSIRDYIYAIPSDAAHIYFNGKKPLNHIRVDVCEAVAGEEAVRSVSHLSAAQLDTYTLTGGTAMQAVTLSEDNTELVENCFMQPWGSWDANYTGYDTLKFRLPRTWKSVLLSAYNIGASGGAFMTEDRVFITSIDTSYPAHLTAKEIPENAAYLYLTVKSGARYNTIYGYLPEYTLPGLNTGGSSWRGRKVVWMGTSVPHGTSAGKSYIQEASNALGFELVPAVTPGLNIVTDNGASIGSGSLTLKLSEYAAQGTTITSAPPVWTPGGNWNNYYTSYENVFTAANANADLFVFDVVPNNPYFDLTDWNLFDPATFTYTDGSSFDAHRGTFLGAMLFLLRKMYDLNPGARAVLFIGSQLNYERGKAAFELLSEAFNIPIINAWGKMGVHGVNILEYVASTTDPHLNDYAHELIGRIAAGELSTIA